MKTRWTMKELAEKSDEEILIGILSERLSTLNPYAPLARKLGQIRTRLTRTEDRRTQKSFLGQFAKRKS